MNLVLVFLFNVGYNGKVETLMERKMFDLNYIFETFRKLETATEKVEFIQNLKSLDLDFRFNYDNLISAWEKIAKSEVEVETVA